MAGGPLTFLLLPQVGWMYNFSLNKHIRNPTGVSTNASSMLGDLDRSCLHLETKAHALASSHFHVNVLDPTASTCTRGANMGTWEWILKTISTPLHATKLPYFFQ